MKKCDETKNTIQQKVTKFSMLYTALTPEYTGGKELSLSKKILLFKQIITTFNELICEIFQINSYPKINLENIVQGIIFKSQGDKVKKYKNQTYYIQNSNAFNYVANQIIELTKLKKHHSKVASYNFNEIIKNLSFDCRLLIQRSAEFKKIKLKRSIWKVEYQRDYDMIRGIKILLYGQDNLQYLIPNNSESSLGIIRIALENRIRSAIGCYGIVNKNEIEPLALSVIFNKLNKYKRYIQFAIKLENIIRIYKWTNMYVHTGNISYCWYPYIIHDYLARLFVGGKVGNGYSIYAGIQIPENIVYKIWSEIENEFSKKTLLDRFLLKKTNSKYLYRISDTKYLNAIIIPPCKIM